MNGLVAPKPAATALPRWTRHAEFLVYLVPVGTISTELYDGYVRLLQAHSVLAIRSLTRPGGYAAELSPFRSFAWDGAGAIRFRFVSTTDKIDTFDGEDVHAGARAVGVLGICHCPTTPSLAVAYQQFMDSIRHFPGLLIQKCFAFEHQFDQRTGDECAGLTHLVMFPVYHELDRSGGGDGVVMSTVSLHLQVVLDTLCVTILMSLESTVRAAVRQQQTQTHAPMEMMGDAAGFLLDTNVEPSTTAQLQQQQQLHSLSPFATREPQSSGGSTPTNDRAMPSGGVSSLFVSAETRNRRRHLARQRKLFGDYAVLLSCVPDALEHYVAAIELLRDEERKSGGAPGDTLWLAAALEGYVFCLYQQCQDKFYVEIVEKASEAVMLYARAGVSELEISLIEHIGLYYTAVAVQLSSQSGVEKMEEATWVKRLLWEVVERGVAVFPELATQRQVQFLIQSASMLEAVGHHRRMALYLHEAVALLAQKWRPVANGLLMTSPGSQTNHPRQRAQELHVALRLEAITAQRLGMADRSTWEPTSLRRRTRRLRKLQRQQHHKKAIKVTTPMAVQEVEPWLVLRFHVLRQLVSIAKLLAEPFLVGRHCIQLLQVLAWCDEIAQPSSSGDSAPQLAVDQPQSPFSLDNPRASAGYRGGLHTSTRVSGGGAASGSSSGPHFHGVYATPPASIEVKSKRYFNMSNSPSATMSTAAATITSTIANTPRTLLATPRQQFSAAVNAISTKASPVAFSSFSNPHYNTPSSTSFTPPSVAVSKHRSSSANAVDLMNGVSSGMAAANLNGARSIRSGSDVEIARASNGFIAQSEPSPTWGHYNRVDGLPSPVWDLRSRVEIQRLQRRVLSILEAECAVLRPTEQLKLDSFIHVDGIRILYDAQRNPLLKKDVALARCGVLPANGTVTESPAFFYNPFDKQKTSSGVATKFRRTSSDSDSDDETDGQDGTSSSFERCFPIYERVQVEVTLSNPYGIELDLQQVAVWIDAPPNPSPSSGTSIVEAYPSSVVLQPYEKRKKIVLGVRGLRAGAFHVAGCFIKVLNIKTSFRIRTPLPLEIVEALPVLSLSLVEIGSLSEEADAGGGGLLASLETDASIASMAITDPICMFANETKRCVLHVSNTGQRAVRTLHVTVRAGKSAMSLSVAQSRTVFSTMEIQSAESLLAFETEGLYFKCIPSGNSLASLLPLERGDHLTIPFEVSLRSVPTRATANRQEQLQWTFFYGEDTDASTTVYYRESQQVVTLVSLGSLQIRNVQVIPTSFVMLPSSLDSTDDDACTVVVEVANPTETVFLVRVRPSVMESGSTSGQGDWDIEIGRQSSRCLVVKIPRVESTRVAERSGIADLLNECLELTWKTYFGTTGSLFFHEGLWSESEREIILLHLIRSDFSFQLQAQDGLELSRSEDPQPLKAELRDGGSPFPFRFYKSALPELYQPVEFVAKLFQPCVMAIRVRHDWSSPADLLTYDDGEAASASGSRDMEVEVVIVRESETSIELLQSEDDEAVMVAGQSQRVLSPADTDAVVNGSSVEWKWSIKCVFLSEGVFDVTVGGRRSLGIDGNSEEAEVMALSRVWYHAPLRIRCIR